MTQAAPNFNQFDPQHEAAREAHIASTTAAMVAAGEIVEEKVEFVDYFTFEERLRWYFPDKKHYIEYKPMTEGDRRKYQSKTMTTMSMNRASGDSKIGINVARDREELLNISVIGWFMERRDGLGNIVSVDFTDKNHGWNAWSTRANPKYIEDLEKAIRKANPWMQSDLDIDEIDAEIDRLQTLRTELRDRQLGEESSSNK